MEILSHRGYWKRPTEKNSIAAFNRSFDFGYGTETDLRDINGKLVISHDIPDSNAIAVEILFSLYNNSKFHCRPTLALNVKADGLQKLVRKQINHFNIEKYFLFDMSIPDLLAYKNEGLKFFVRFSEYEPISPLLKEAEGVWLDGFKETILDKAIISSLLIRNKKVCLVSPELHAREHFPVWEKIKQLSDSIVSSNNFFLCTDFPEDATRFFYGNKNKSYHF